MSKISYKNRKMILVWDNYIKHIYITKPRVLENLNSSYAKQVLNYSKQYFDWIRLISVIRVYTNATRTVTNDNGFFRQE